MRYISTRGGIQPVSFQDAVLSGLADDGGLLIPEAIPDVRGELDRWRALPYGALALEVLRRFVSDIPEKDLEALVARTYTREAFVPDPAPIVEVGPLSVLELWHGPTLAFKDLALQLLGNLFEHILARRGGRLNILGATSGDTGSAAIHGVRGRRGIAIFMMYPHARVSPIQERQMITVPDGNVHPIAVRGSFDDCQRIMKDLASDLDFKRRHGLGAVNSVNWARILAQIVYYFRAAFEVQARTGAAAVQMAVPTGNFGDVLAGWYALKMGAPISRLILATNENDILAVFFGSGLYRRGSAVETPSPSMDIQVASNFERYLFYRMGSDPVRLRSMMAGFAKTGELRVEPGPGGVIDPVFRAGSAGRQEVLDTIRRYWKERRYLLDPHTAVGVAVAERLRDPAEPLVCLATAHPAKFPDAIREATGEDLARHPAIDALLRLEPREVPVLPADRDAVRHHMEETLNP
jgi:threonine synthase